MYTNTSKKIRIGLLPVLVFSFLWISCADRDEKKPAEELPAIDIIMEGTKATGLSIPRELLGDVPDDSIEQWVKVHLAPGDNNPAMLGRYIIEKDHVEFIPLIPLTTDIRYEVRLKGESISQIEIERIVSMGYPDVLDVYPTTDTVPENLLKLYIEFSKPMQEGKALEYIKLVKNGDTLPDSFLELQPELWNKESTILTVWFDPGRIKRDLQPNLAKGPPLTKGMKYEIVIKAGWPDKEGAGLEYPHIKAIYTTVRDSLSPDPSKWAIEVPKPESDQPVEVVLHEPLDYLLLKNALHVTDSKGADVQGTIAVKNKEKSIEFTPSSPWKAGNYILEVESRLGDLAGNNLNRPFDNDLTQQQTEQKAVFKRTFQIR
jgi:hypothetical protein